MLKRVSFCILLLGLSLSTTGCWCTNKVEGRFFYQNDLHVEGAQILPDSSLVLTVRMMCEEECFTSLHPGRKSYRRYIVLDKDEHETALKSTKWRYGPCASAKVVAPGAEGWEMYPYHVKRKNAQPSDLPFSLKDAQQYDLRQDVAASPYFAAKQEIHGEKIPYIPIRYKPFLPRKMRNYKPLRDKLCSVFWVPAVIVDVVTFPIQVFVVSYQICMVSYGINKLV